MNDIGITREKGMNAMHKAGPKPTEIKVSARPVDMAKGFMPVQAKGDSPRARSANDGKKPRA
ncbi:hypothetical protein I6F15_04450 [Bradyrhizobium sp. BRP14]|nr:hypothetical protein [Bradyrhizobium sp. BRP14]